MIVAVFAYFIATDSTPNADRQIVEIQAKKPGFTQLFLKVKKEKKITSPAFLPAYFWLEDNDLFIPINNFQESGDSVIVQKYIDEGVEERQAFPKYLLPEKIILFQKLSGWALINLAVIF